MVAVQIDATSFFENALAERGCRRQSKMLHRVGRAKKTRTVTLSQDGKRATLGERRQGESEQHAVWMTFDESAAVFRLAAADGFFQCGEVLVRRRRCWPQGGEESEEACAVDTHHVEVSLHLSARARKKAKLFHPKYGYGELIAGARVVDNILFWSAAVCQECIVHGHTEDRSYPRDVNMQVEEEGPLQKFLHSDLHVTDEALVLVPHSHNREFSQGKIALQKVCRLLPPFEAPFKAPQLLRQFLAQAFARFQQITPNDSFLALETALDLIGECCELGFAPRQILQALQCQKPNRYTPLLLTLRSALKNAARLDKQDRRRHPLRTRSAPVTTLGRFRSASPFTVSE
jgi:hypothetical protein